MPFFFNFYLYINQRTGNSTPFIVRATDSVLVSALVLLDLSAAFDTVDHRILLDVLSFRFGDTDRVYEWFSSYLTGRTQVISSNTSTSAAVALTYGVPQGSVVGPQQFTAYTDVSLISAACSLRGSASGYRSRSS